MTKVQETLSAMAKDLYDIGAIDEILLEPVITEAEMDAFMERTARQIAGDEEAFK